MENKSICSIDIGFFGLLQLIFITLKLCGVINWSWWAVLLPTLINVSFYLITILVILLFYFSKINKDLKFLFVFLLFVIVSVVLYFTGMITMNIAIFVALFPFLFRFLINFLYYIYFLIKLFVFRNSK